MSRHHIATHAYDFRRGWVRVPRTSLTTEHAVALREQGFTIVRSRRGWFRTRELPLSWYLPRTSTDMPPSQPLGPADVPSATLVDRGDSSDAGTPSKRRARSQADGRDR